MRSDHVSKRVTEIQEATAKKSAIKRTDLITFLHQFVQIEFSPELIRPSDAIKAAELIAKLCGWNEPETVLLGPSNELTNVLLRLRNGDQSQPLPTSSNNAITAKIQDSNKVI